MNYLAVQYRSYKDFVVADEPFQGKCWQCVFAVSTTIVNFCLDFSSKNKTFSAVKQQ